MNYLKEILAFENWKDYNSQINQSDVCLWYTLIFMANRFNWEEFNVPISTLIFKSRMNQSAVYRSRNKLKQLGLIDFKERSGNQSAIYKINSVNEIYESQNERQDERQIERQFERQFERQPERETENIHKTINQKLKTKNQKKESIADAIPKEWGPVRVYGEFRNVLLSDDEHEKLKELCGEELQGVIDHLSSYIEMKGYKVKSHYLAIRKWVITAYKEQKMREKRLADLSGGVGYGRDSRYPQKKLCTEYPE